MNAPPLAADQSQNCVATRFVFSSLHRWLRPKFWPDWALRAARRLRGFFLIYGFQMRGCTATRRANESSLTARSCRHFGQALRARHIAELRRYDYWAIIAAAHSMIQGSLLVDQKRIAPLLLRAHLRDSQCHNDGTLRVYTALVSLNEVENGFL